MNFNSNMLSWLDEARLGVSATEAAWATTPVFWIARVILAIAGAAAILIGVVKTALDYIYITQQPLFNKIYAIKQKLKCSNSGGNGIGRLKGFAAGFGSAYAEAYEQDGIVAGLGMTILATLCPDISVFTSYAEEMKNGAAGAGEKGKLNVKAWLTGPFVLNVCTMVIGFLLASGFVIKIVALGYNGVTYGLSIGLGKINPTAMIDEKFGGNYTSSFITNTAKDHALYELSNQAYAAYNSTTLFSRDDKISSEVRTKIEEIVKNKFNEIVTVSAFKDNSDIEWDAKIFKFSANASIRVNKAAVEQEVENINRANSVKNANVADYYQSGAFYIDISPGNANCDIITDTTALGKEFYIFVVFDIQQTSLRVNSGSNSSGGTTGGGSASSRGNSNNNNQALDFTAASTNIGDDTTTFTDGPKSITYDYKYCEDIEGNEDKVKKEIEDKLKSVSSNLASNTLEFNIEDESISQTKISYKLVLSSNNAKKVSVSITNKGSVTVK